jgi:threonine synthase
MDIQIASNFERYLYYLFSEDSDRVTKAFKELKESGRITFTPEEMMLVRRDFCSVSVNQDATLRQIKDFHLDTGYLLDPHTAVGVKAALDLLPHDSARVCLATAHPAKFSETVEQSLGFEMPMPETVKQLYGKPTKCEIMDNDINAVRNYIISHISL